MDADDPDPFARVCRTLAVCGTVALLAAVRYGAPVWVGECVGLATAVAWYWSGD